MFFLKKKIKNIKNKSEGIIIKSMTFERSIIAFTFLSSAYIHRKINIEVKGNEARIPAIKLLFLLITETSTTMIAVIIAFKMSIFMTLLKINNI